MTPPPVLQWRGLAFGYGGQPPLFNGLDLALPAGVTLIDGETGCGKSTLLRLLAGELAGHGERRLNGLRCGDDPTAWRQAVCWFDVRDPRFDALTAEGLMHRLRQTHAALDEAAWRQLHDRFGLAEHAGKPLYMLSRGSRQKAALAVALNCQATLTLLDEATAGLDAAALRTLALALQHLPRNTPRAVVMASSVPLPGFTPAAHITLPG
ncbi:MAG: ATP-binding cassette domain-containing protein [Rubrivivax sp.]|nr:ATP-binding cassette domain-containing protein [Rubrivivax sp.]